MPLLSYSGSRSRLFQHGLTLDFAGRDQPVPGRLLPFLVFLVSLVFPFGYQRYNIRYTTTPVTLTYIQIGNVHRAMARCRATSIRKPRRSVMIASTGVTTARLVCVVRIVKYTYRSRPVFW